MLDTQPGSTPPEASMRDSGRSLLQLRSRPTQLTYPAACSSRADWTRHSAAQLSCRGLRCEKGVLSRADGSAKWTQEKSCVLVGLYGPKLTSVARADPEHATVQVSFKPAKGQSGARERQIEKVVRRAVEGAIISLLYPRTLISISIQEIADDGGVLSSSLNAVNAALMDAGISMRCTFAAAATCIDPSGRLLVDPDRLEEEASLGLMTGCFTARLKSPEDAKATISQKLLVASMLGSMQVEQFWHLRDVTRRACTAIAGFSRLSALQAFSDALSEH